MKYTTGLDVLEYNTRTMTSNLERQKQPVGCGEDLLFNQAYWIYLVGYALILAATDTKPDYYLATALFFGGITTTAIWASIRRPFE